MKFMCAVCLVLVFAAIPLRGGDEKKDALKLVNLETINTEADEDDPFTPDGLNLYYASNMSGNWEIMISKRPLSSGRWPVGKVHLSGKETDFRSPFLRGNTFYFATNKVPDEKLKDLRNFDIVQQIGDRAPLPLVGISEKEDELHPWITPGGKEFYFSRKLKEGWKLFVAHGPAPGPIGKAKEVGFPAGFHHATLSQGTLFMYLEGPLEDGRRGLFKSKRAKVGAAWSMPEALTQLNDAEGKRGNLSPSLSGDGTRLYFSSDRPGGKGGLDIWSVFVKDLK